MNYKCTTCGETFTDFTDCNGDSCNRCDDGYIEQVDSEDAYYFDEDDWGLDEEWED